VGDSVYPAWNGPVRLGPRIRGEKAMNPMTRHRYLMGAMQQLQLTMTIRLMCIQDDVARLPRIVEAWRAASARMIDLASKQGGTADAVAIANPPDSVRPRLEELAADPLFQGSFSDLPTSFRVVELDKIVAPQRDVNLDFVESLRPRIPGSTVEELVEFCVGPRGEAPEIQTLQTAQNQMTFSSRNVDLRFLGGFPKQISEEDIRLAQMGGHPVAAITLLVGFGATPINAYMVGPRLVLANGFHRVIALRSAGVTHAPIVVRHVTNPDIEFPEQFIGLPRTYLLQNPRPVLVQDFFDDALCVDLTVKPRKKVLKVSWGTEDGVVPE